MKKHDTSTGNGDASKPVKPSASDKPSSKPEKPVSYYSLKLHFCDQLTMVCG